MAKEPKGANDDGAADDGTQEPEVQDNKIIIDGEEYDPQRALKTIQKQREAEAQLKADLAKYKAQEEAEAEEQKSLEQKLIDRDNQVLELKKELAVRNAAKTFRAQAAEAGIADPELALLAAQADGLVGDFDPETGQIEVGKVDFDKLVERHPVLQGKAPDGKPTGNAGRLGSGKVLTAGERFSRAVRGMDE